MIIALAESVAEWLKPPETLSLFRVTLLLIFGLIVMYGGGWLVSALLTRHASVHMGIIGRKVVVYTGGFLLLVSLLLEMGFDLTGVLATAGIATVAVGFAAQTSLSNLISGLFLIGERPFEIGDLIKVSGTTGVVLSIDLLSIKLRTLDNLFIRIPNEEMIKSQVTNITRFPIRRMDLDIGVAYKEDPEHVIAVLKSLAKANRFVLEEPEAIVIFNQFGQSALEFRFCLWFEKSNFLALKNSIMVEIKKRFDAEGIEIPFPYLTLYSGSETGPFPLRILNPESGEK